MKIVQYHQNQKVEWNDFLKCSKNSSFLFERDFMDYHSDRFQDNSLMIYNQNKLVAIVPANKAGNSLVSHQGLSYGGVIVGHDVSFKKTIEIFRELLKYLNESGVEEFILKPIPRFYLESSCDEQEWILFKLNAELFRRDVSCAINMTKCYSFQERKKRSIKKAEKNNVIVRDCELREVEIFWDEVLKPNLEKKWGILPVHTKDEILKLMRCFPDEIKLHGAFIGNELIAGTVVFIVKSTAHAQYISSNEKGKNLGALDLLFSTLLRNIYKDFKVFDFGISNESAGRKINLGLLEWKEGFGASKFSHDFYKLKTNNYIELMDVLPEGQ